MPNRGYTAWFGILFDLVSRVDMSRPGGGSEVGRTRSILVMSDLGSGSDGLVRTGAWIAHLSGGQLHVLHAMGLHGLSLREAFAPLHECNAQQIQQALEQQLERSLPGPVRAVTYGVDYQAPSVALRHRAREVQADLIVIGPQEPRTIGPGSEVSLRESAATSGVEVLVGRTPLRWPPRRVLLPLGEDDLASGFLRTAGSWLDSTLGQAEHPLSIHVLHVAAGLRGWREFAPVLDTAIRHFEEEATGESRLRVRRTVRWGSSPSGRILDVAAESRPDLIVLPALAADSADGGADSGVRRRVLEDATCSVLLLPEGSSTDARPAKSSRAPHLDDPGRNTLDALNALAPTVASAAD